MSSYDFIALQSMSGNVGKGGNIKGPKSSGDTSDFPTLLNIPWNSNISKVASDESANQKPELDASPDSLKDTGDVNIATDENSVPLTVDGAQTKLPVDNELANAISQGLLTNPNLTVSVSVEGLAAEASEPENLMKQFEQLQSKVSAPVSLLNSRQQSGDEIIDPGQSSEAKIKSTGFSPEAASARTLQSDSKLLSKADAKINQGQGAIPLAQRIGQPAVGTGENFVTLDPAAYRERPVVTDALEKTNRLESASNTKAAAQVYSDNTPLIRVLKNETSPSFLQAVHLNQLPERISSIAAGLETLKPTAAASSLSAESSAQPLVRFEVQLVPKNLGTVEVLIQKQGENVTISIKTDTAEAERLLNTESSAIRDSIKSIGLVAEDIKIQTGALGNREGDHHQERAYSPQNQHEGSSDDRGEPDNRFDQASSLLHPADEETIDQEKLLRENPGLGIYM